MLKIKNYKYLLMFFILILIFLYKDILNFGFLDFDDIEYIRLPFILSGLSIHNIYNSFSSMFYGYWIPITWISHMLDIELFGLWAGGHHLTNFIIHCFNGCILYLFLNKLLNKRDIALWISVFFLIHPLQVEPVVWVADRKGLLGCFFYILSCLTYLHYINKKTIFKYLSLHIFFFIGFMSKPVVVTFPFILFIFDAWPLNRFKNNYLEILKEKITLIILSGLFSYITYKNCSSLNILTEIPLNLKIFHIFFSYAEYIKKVIFPYPLTVFYPHSGNISGIDIITSLIILIALTFVSFRKCKKRGYIFLGLGWFFLTLIPMIGIVQAGLHAYADRFMYIPIIGIIIIYVFSIYDLKLSVDVKEFILFITFLIFIGFTFFQVQKWKTPESLWKHTLKHTSNNSLACINLGCIYLKNEDLESAKKYFNMAILYGCTDPLLYQNIGLMYLNLKNFNKAEEYLQKAILKKPDLVEAHQTLGILYLDQNNYEKAMKCFENVLKINPDFYDAKHNLIYAKNKLIKKNQ